MGVGALDRKRVVVAHGKVRSDISIPSNAPLGHTLNVLGLIQPGTVVLLPNGHIADLNQRPDTPSQTQRIADGTLLTVISPETSSTGDGNKTKTAKEKSHGKSHRAIWWFVACLTAVSVAASWLNSTTPDPGDSNGVAYGIASAALAVASLISAIVTTRTPRGTTNVPALSIPPLLAFGAGYISIPAQMAQAAHLAMLCGFLAATTAAAIVHLRSSKLLTMNATGLTLGTLAITSALWGATLQLDLPLAFAAAVCAGFAPLALRILPTICLDVEDGQLIEYEQFMSGKWTVRGATPAPASLVTENNVSGMMNNARSQLATGTVLFSAIPALMLPIVFMQVANNYALLPGASETAASAKGLSTNGTLEIVGTITLAICVLLSLSLSPRRAGSPLQRWAPRVGAAMILAQLALIVPTQLQDSEITMGAIVLITAGVGSVVSIVPLSRGIRSLNMSRLADAIEALATSIALPAALVSANIIELVRGMVSS